MAVPSNKFTTRRRHGDEPEIFKLSVVGLPEPAAQQRTAEPKLSFQSGLMQELFELAKTYARSSAAVIVAGESGTGKELFSRLIHQHSSRDQFPFVAVNCAAISETLAESEFFGHEKGSFTGAERYHIGHFERANGGTLLLDEISEIPTTMQAKMLRVIEEQEVLPVGGTSTRPIDVRIIATTNRELAHEVEQGKFREDLFHRLNVLELRLPPLRERKTDIPSLVQDFIQQFQSESIAGQLTASPEAMAELCNRDWPGNVRQLRNVIHRACVICKDSEIGISCLQVQTRDSSNSECQNFLFGMKLAEVERHLILAALQKYGGSKRLAADELGVTPRTLANKLRGYHAAGVKI